MPERTGARGLVSVSVVVLTRNEAPNLEECLGSVRWASEALVVDSFSTDATVEIAERLGARVFLHAFEACADQWNWALDNLPFSNEWVLVLDADERIPQPLAAKIAAAVGDPAQACAGFYLRRRLWFMGRWLRHGGLYPAWIMRLFKRDAGRFGRHGVSEHLILNGQAGYLLDPFDHRDNKPLYDWIQRHNRYSELEAEEHAAASQGKSQAHSIAGRLWGSQAERKQWIKLRVWGRLPLFVRPFLLFCRNYILKGGLLDGRQGFIYHVLWSFWYPFLISVKIIEKRVAASSLASLELPAATVAPKSGGGRKVIRAGTS